MNSVLYEWPGAGYLFFFAPLLFFLFWQLKQHRQHVLSNLADPTIMAKIVTPRDSVLFWSKSIFLCAGWALAVLALTQPIAYGEYPESVRYGKPQAPKPTAPQLIFLLIDSSASMTTPDALGGQTRISYAQAIADALLARLQGEPVGLYTFAENPLVLSPPTPDYFFVTILVRDLQINEAGTPGTNFTNLFKSLHDDYGSVLVKKSAILLTDGEDTSLEFLSFSERTKATEKLLGLAEGFQWIAVGIGSLKGAEVPKVLFEGKPVISAVNETLLKAIAKDNYFFANDSSAAKLAEDIGLLVSPQPATLSPKALHDLLDQTLYYQFPLGLAILCLLLGWFLPDSAFRRVLFCLCMLALESVSADASTFEDRLRQATVLSEAHAFDSAREAYQKLLAAPLSADERVAASYNLGTLYLQQHQWEDAISVFEAIEINSDTPPLFVRYIKTNLALAYLRQAEESPPQDKPTFDKIWHRIGEGIRAVKDAEDAACILNHRIGFDTCPVPSDLTALNKALIHQFEVLKNMPPPTKTTPSEKPQNVIPQNEEEKEKEHLLNQLQLMDQQDKLPQAKMVPQVVPSGQPTW